jgi:hypothetical protein
VFFTNPFRENDKVTKWVKKHIRDPFKYDRNLWFMLCIARQLNRPDTLQHLMDRNLWPTEDRNRWEAKRAAKALNQWRDAGQAIYTGAYMIAAPSGKNPYTALPSKQHYITEIVLGQLWKNACKTLAHKILYRKSLQVFTEWLSTFTGWGGFLSYEVACDLLYTRHLYEATDRFTWANPGPGAYRGLNWLKGEDVTVPMKKEVAVEVMRDLLEIVQLRNPCAEPRHIYDMRTIEHSLCEFDKYNRALFQTGRLKRMYPGR